MSKPIIIGAGPAGLTAAYMLAERGEQPVILEQSNKVGGIARTEVHNGYRFDRKDMVSNIAQDNCKALKQTKVA